MSEKKSSVAGSLFWKLSERFLAQIVSFVVSIVLGRILMPEQYGVVSLVLIFITFADVLVNSGFSTSLIQKKDADDTDFSTIFYLSFAVALISYAVLFFAAPFISIFFKQPDLTLVIRIFALRIPVGAFNSIQHAYVSRHMLFKKFFFSTFGGTVISAVVGIFMAIKGYGVWALVAQYLTNTFIDTIVLLFTVSWKPKALFSWSRAKSLMDYGTKVMLADLSGTFFDQLRSLVIGRFYLTSDLAFYNKGKQFPALTTDTISSAIMSVLFPALSNQSDNTDDVKDSLRKAIRMMSYLIFPMTVGLCVCARPLIITLLTEKWANAIIFLQILSIASAVALVGNISLQALKAIGRSDVLLRLEFVKKPVYVALLALGVWTGVEAIAWTMLIYNIYALIINAGSLKRTLGYMAKEQFKDVRTAILLSLAMAAVTWPVNLIPIPEFAKLLIIIALSVLVYALLSIVSGCESWYMLMDKLQEKVPAVKKIRRRCTYLFRVNKKKIVFSNFGGRAPGGSPLAIANEIKNRRDDIEIVWVNGTARDYRELATASVWVDNIRNTDRPKKKKKQFYMQTWHGGTGYKLIEGEARDTLDSGYMETVKYDGSITDVILAQDSVIEKVMSEHFDLNANTQIAPIGSPCNDVFFDDIYKKKVTRDKNCPVILYAPTFRDNGSVEGYKLDFKGILKAFDEFTGKRCKLLVHLHPNLSDRAGEILGLQLDKANTIGDMTEDTAASMEQTAEINTAGFESENSNSDTSRIIDVTGNSDSSRIIDVTGNSDSSRIIDVTGNSDNSRIIDVTANPDITGLMCMADYLISDYSVVALDFATHLKCPVFLCMTDYEEYTKNRKLRPGSENYPLIKTYSSEELIAAIKSFDSTLYQARLERFLQRFDLYDKGDSAKRAADIILDFIDN